MDVKFINICLRDVRDLQELFIYGLEIPSVNVCHRDVRSSVYITPDSDLPVLNGLGPESSLNGLNGLNGRRIESGQEKWVTFWAPWNPKAWEVNFVCQIFRAC